MQTELFFVGLGKGMRLMPLRYIPFPHNSLYYVRDLSTIALQDASQIIELFDAKPFDRAALCQRVRIEIVETDKSQFRVRRPIRTNQGVRIIIPKSFNHEEQKMAILKGLAKAHFYYFGKPSELLRKRNSIMEYCEAFIEAIRPYYQH